MAVRMILMLLFVGVIFGSIFGYKVYQDNATSEQRANYRPPAVSVSASYAMLESWPITLSSVGTLTARNGVNVSTEVEGTVKEIFFKSGEYVSKGDPLVALDDSVEQANLRSFSAQYRLAQLNFERDKQMIEKKLTAQDQFDRSVAQLDDARARVEQTRATIDKKKIRAAFSGRIGIRKVDLGQFLAKGQEIVALEDISTLYADFNLPEKDLAKVNIGQSLTFSVDSYEGEVFLAEVVAIDARISSTTRNLLVRAEVNNPEEKLVPGMFAAVQLTLQKVDEVVTLPSTAVTYSLYGEEVYVVKEIEGITRASRRNIKAGRQTANKVAIVDGVAEGELVITDGQLKLNNGTLIKVTNQEQFSAPEAQ